MVKATHNGANNTALVLTGYNVQRAEAEVDGPRILELVDAAFARLLRDLDKYHPHKPAIVYALVGETHKVMVQGWQREYPADIQSTLLAGLLDETIALVRHLQARAARIAPTNGFMYGMQDEAIKLETQIDVALEELHRIEAELRELGRVEAIQ